MTTDCVGSLETLRRLMPYRLAPICTQLGSKSVAAMGNYLFDEGISKRQGTNKPQVKANKRSSSCSRRRVSGYFSKNGRTD
jgi:hypothetical protein